MAKKFLATILAVIALVSCTLLFACVDEEKPEVKEEQPPVTTEVYYEVNFEADGGTPAPQEQSVKEGEKVIEPTAPAKEGFTFDGWYCNESKWSFTDSIVEEDMTLTARWTEIIVNRTIEKRYEFDYQILEGGKIEIDFEGSAPSAVVFGEPSSSNKDYAPVWAVKGNKIEVVIASDMMELKGNMAIKFSIGINDYVCRLTMNPITSNYFIVDGSEPSYKLAIAGIESATFNGTDISSVSGITKDATGLTFTKELLATKLGHNKVEVKTENKTYVLSVCAVTTEQVSHPITFEDGKMSPFMAVSGGEYKVVKVADDVSDAEVKRYYRQLTYVTGASRIVSENQYALELDNKAKADGVKAYVSSFYTRERLKAMATHDSAYLPLDYIHESGYLAASNFGNNGFYLSMRQCASEFTRFKGEADYYSKVGNKDLASTGGSYFWTGYKEPCGKYKTQFSRVFISKEGYDLMITSSGILVEKYQTIIYRVPQEGDSHKIYLDDIGACIQNQGESKFQIALPGKSA